MVTATLYIEGGGSGRSLEIRFRKGWKAFFNAAGVGARTKVVRGGSRDDTFKRFKSAVRDHREDVLPLLLVDSEGKVQSGHTPWQHLLAKDGWEKPDGAGENQAFLMVQFMETWFLADRNGLRSYFGSGFKDQEIKQWPELEEVYKETVSDALERATSNCGKVYKKKTKGKISFELLAHINPDRVKAACPHAKELLKRLAALADQERAQ